MFNFTSLFGAGASHTSSGVPAIYPFTTPESLFIKTDIVNAYKRILIDVVEKSSGMPGKHEHIWWDSCVQSESETGLISMLANAMFNKSELYVVYKEATGVVRMATSDEQRVIREEYKKKGQSKAGVYISFQKYDRTDMLRIYSILEYCVLCSLHKTINLSKAIQIKIKGIRSNIALGDSEAAIAQAKEIAAALGRGDEILIDKEDDILTATVDTAPTEKAMEFLEKKKSFILGLPTSYISGDQTPGIGSTGEADMRAVEKGLKQYFFSIIRPAIKDLLGITLEFRSDDFRYITTSLSTLKDFEVTTDDLISRRTKRKIIAKMFYIDPKEEEKQIKKEESETANTNPGTVNDQGDEG